MSKIIALLIEQPDTDINFQTRVPQQNALGLPNFYLSLLDDLRKFQPGSELFLFPDDTKGSLDFNHRLGHFIKQNLQCFAVYIDKHQWQQPSPTEKSDRKYNRFLQLIHRLAFRFPNRSIEIWVSLEHTEMTRYEKYCNNVNQLQLNFEKKVSISLKLMRHEDYYHYVDSDKTLMLSKIPRLNVSKPWPFLVMNPSIVRIY